jgi:hypothetical protein
LNRLIILLVLLGAIVAGCVSGQGSPTATPEPTATEEPTPEPTEEPTEEASADAEGSFGAFPSFDLNGDPELAARFPDTVGGEPLEVQSFRGDVFGQMGGADPSFQAFLDSVGADLEDVSVAFGGSMSQTGTDFLSVAAFRVLGASEDDLEREFIAASEEAGEMSGITEANIGGKDVWTATDPTGETEGQVVLYANDDTLYFLTGTDAQVTEILAALP